MIFKTVTNDITGATEQISIFNSTLSTMKRNLSSGQGITYSIFNGNKITQNDIQAITNYANALKSGVGTGKAWQANMSGCSVAAKQYVVSAKQAGKTTDELVSGLKTVPKATTAASVGLKALSIAGNMIAFMAISEAISFAVKYIDDYVHRIDNMKEALEESTSSFEETTNEVTDLQDELKTCQDRLAELQKLADNGTISVADQNELDTLKKTNDELERKLALKKAEQIEEQQNVLNDNEDLLNETFSSKYKTFHYASGAQQVESALPVTIPEELGYALDEFDGLNYALEQGTINQKEFDDQTKSVKDDIVKYAETVNESVDAYNKLIDAGVELQGDDLVLYNTLKALQDRYLLYNYTLYGTAEAYKALSEEQKKKIIVDKLEQQGLSDSNAEEVYNNMSDDQKDNFYEIGFEFKAPDETDYKNATDYAKAYITAMFGSAKEEIEKQSTNIASSLSFKDALNSDDNKDVAKELKTLAEAGELTPNTLTSTKEYNKLLKETKTSAQEATEQLYNMVDANTRLSAFSNNMGNVDKAYAEFKTDGFNTMDTLSGLQSAFGDLDYYNKFIQIAGNAKSSTQEIQSAYNKLVTEYVYSIGILDNVNESNKGLIQTQLEHLGITNAEEIVTKALNGEILSLADAKSILTQHGYDLMSVTSGELNALVKEGNVSKETAQQIALFALKKKIANGVSITTDGDIANLAALAGVSSDVIEMMGSLATMKKKIAEGIGEAGTAGGKEELERHAKALEKRINNRLNKGKQINFNIDYTGGDTTSNALEKQTNKNKKTITKFSQTIDWCAETITNLSNKISNLNAKLNNTDGLQKQIKYYKQLITAQNGLIKGYEKTANRYQKAYNNALKKLSKSDQNKVKNGTYTIEQFSGKAKSGKKSSAEKRYNNIQSAIEARDNLINNSTDLEEAKAQLKEYAEALASVRWDKASERVEKLNSKLSVLETRMGNVSGYKAKNKVLNDQLKLQKQILTAQENAVKNTQTDANSYYKKISAKYKKNKNSDGTIKTTGVTNATQLKYIKIYNAYVKQLAEKTVELSQAQEDYTAAVNEAAITRADNVKNDYDNKISLLDATKNQIDAEIALAEARGQVASAEYYKSLNANSNERMAQLKEEKTLLEKQLSTLEPYSDTWYEVKQSVIEVDQAIADETQNAVENINKQIEATQKLAQAKNNYLSSTIGTNDWLAYLTDTDDYSDENGNFTDKGLAIVKSKLNNVELYRQQAENFKGNINELDAMHENGEIDDATWLNNRIELVEELQNVTKSMYDEEQSLHDMYIDNLKEQSEALKKLIDKKKEALEADKSEYDYRKSITEKTKNIADLQKQLAMLEGDNSEEAMAQRQQVQVKLDEAEEDLKDTQYEKYLERLEDSLDDLQDRFDVIIDKLDKQGALPSIEELTSLVNENADAVTNGVDQIIKDAGLDGVLGENGLGYLNTTANDLLNSPESQVATKIDETNSWLCKIYDATIGGSTDDSSNDSGESGATTISSTQQNTTGITGTIGTEKIAIPGENILQKAAEYSLPKSGTSTNTSVLDMDGQNLTSGNNEVLLSKTTANKAKTFINQNATKSEKKKSEYGILNKKIYEMTNGKILSKANRLKLAKMLNVTDANKDGDITGAEAKKVVELLKQIPGFSHGGIVEVAKRNGDDGFITVKAGEAVLTPVQTTALMELGKNLVPLNNLVDVIQRPNIPSVERGNNSSSTSIDSVNFEFNLPNVVDSESLIKTIQTDTKVQKTLENATIGKLNSGNRKLGVNRL